ncbi:hypothetical protein GYMLUDRAFT_979305 [Collybiopsis luxurians FD-317 M1]|nr:hypothetical protein GYMLUDRAFT_979305 [Collybiopsis luxurians FD-317 M1]
MSPSKSDKQPAAGSFPAESSEEHLVQDAVVVDMPSFNKFSINVPSEPSRPISTPISSDRTALSSSESGDSSDDDDDSGQERENGDTFDANHSPTISTTIRPPIPDQSVHIHPRFSRASSLPLPSQLGHLNHPHRPLSSSLKPPYSDPVTPELDRFKDLSLELADSVQMVVQTMLHISPTQVLDPAKEQFSACALAVPTPSMSAMFTTMKNLNYISANMAAFAAEETHPEDTPLFSNRKHNDFDIGELLQSVGDALSASAAQVGVDLVLFHGDAALKHVWVKGDEPCMSYLLSHLIRQILTISQRGDTIELGLFVNRSSSPQRQNSLSSETEEDDPFKAHFYGEGSFECVVEILHRFSPAGTSEGISRTQPSFSNLATRRLLAQVGATLSENIPSLDGSLEIGCSYRLTFAVEAGLSPRQAPTTTTTEDHQSANEPTLEQLSTFVDTLKGKKVHLYSSSKSSFAHHLTSYLTTWGLDVSHLSTEGGEESASEDPSSPSATTSTSNLEGYTPSGIPPKVEPPRPPKAQPVSFILIDDDVVVLKERLQVIRDEQSYPLNLNSRKRPSLAAHHRPRSSPQVTRISPTVHTSVIMHFTSLANYKLTKNLVQSFLDSYRSSLSSLPIPEIMVIPKPAGPRRFLTALHTAATKPAVDSFFSPIATTPGTPYSFGGGSYLGSPQQLQQRGVSRTSSVHRPSGSRSNSDRSSRSINILENHANLPPSPLSMDNNSEYFSETITKFGETPMKLGVTPRAGVILQNPDGQPAGIFFSPRAEKGNIFSSYSMERDRGHLSVVTVPRRSVSSNSNNEESAVTFASLLEVASAESPASPAEVEKNVQVPTRQHSRSSVSASPTTESSAAQALRKASSDVGSRKGPASPPGSPILAPSLRNARRPKMDAKGLSPAPTNKKGKSPAENNIVPPISVLIVDDNHIQRQIFSAFMKKNQIKYDVASNGKEAVEKWKTGEFHLILMDIQMPIMDGMEATRLIRQIERQNAGYIQPSPSVDSEDHSGPSDDNDSKTSAASPYRSSVIIVALTASSLQSDRIAALAAGCNDFLTKPVSFPWLNNKLIEWGSIKALSMYADMAPDVVKSQNNQARSIAERLHVPKGRKTPPSPPVPKPPSVQPTTSTHSAASAPAQSPRSGSSSAMWSPSQPSAALSFRSHLGLQSPIRAESPGSRSSPDEPTPTPACFTSISVGVSSPVQLSSAAELNGSIENGPKSDPNASTTTLTQRRFDFNASSSKLRQSDASDAKTEEETHAPLEHVRENGSSTA